MTSVEAWLSWLGGPDQVTRVLAAGGLVAARVGPLTVLAPWIALRSAPATVRSALILALTVAFVPLALETAPVIDTTPSLWAFALMREAVIGLLFAFAAALPFFALDWAGRVTDIWRGASLSEVLAPATGDRTSPLGELYLFTGIVLFLTLGGHRFALDVFADSLVFAPIGGVTAVTSFGDVALGAARLSAVALTFAAALAAPAAVCIVLVELSLGLIARAAPQVPVFFAGMPLRAATGLAAALVALTVLIDQLPTAFQDGVESARTLVRLFAG